MLVIAREAGIQFQMDVHEAGKFGAITQRNKSSTLCGWQDSPQRNSENSIGELRMSAIWIVETVPGERIFFWCCCWKEKQS